MSDLAKRIANLPPEKREKLLRKLEEEAKAAQQAQAPAVARDPSQPLPLSFAQHRLWFIDRMQPGQSVYNLPALFRIEGALDVGAFTRAVEALVERHEVLRTHFAEEKGQPVQVVSPTSKVEVPVVDLQGVPEPERASEAERLAREELMRPFDLSKGPLMRMALLRLSEREHLVVMTLHHIVFDIWSMGVLMRDLTELYLARVAGRSSMLPALPMQYGDYARWQREWLKGPVLEEQLAYWRKQLAGLTMLELPADRPRPAVPSFRGATHSFVIPRARVEQLQALAQRQGSSLFMVLLAALKVVLARRAGQADVAVGIPIAGRNRREVEGLSGFFINTLVMRTDLSGNPSFLEALRRVKETSLGAYAHQELPLEHLAAELQPERDPGHTPFYRVSFNLQNAPVGSIDVPGLRLKPQKAMVGMAKLDLSLHLMEGPDGLQSVWEYSTDLFDAGTIQRMAEHFERVLGQVVEAPDRKVMELEVMGAEEHQRVVREWNRTAAELPREACAHELFEARVDRAPQAPALSFEGQTLSYAELDRRANKLARHLQGLGVGPEVRVGLCVERSVELVVGMLGILKAGGAYVPLDPSYPADRLAMMMQEAALPVLLTQGHLADELPAGGEQLVCLDDDWAQVERQPEGRVAAGVVGDNLAYVIFTSGSTGRPKGVMVRHRGLVNTALAAGEEHGVREDSRVLQYASMSFDASVCEVFSTLVAGACLCLAKREELMPGEPLTKTLLEQRISMVTLTPTVLAQQGVEGLEGLETVISAGEACTREVVGKWKPGRKLLNAYGPTEVTVCATINKEVEEQRAGVIGKPWRNVRVYVLDEALQPVPVGVAGELYVGGEGVARGYLGRADLTAEKFVPDALSGEAGARLYRTGDVVKWVEGGSLEYVGRADAQVKVRGFRIELGEVESVLRQQPGVADAVVVAREDGGEKRLVGYYVREEGAEVTAGAVREGLKAKLPEYMVPSALMELEALPLTSSGKVDRKALPEPGAERPELEVAFVAPRNPVEELLASVWAEVLGVERVGVHDSFFDLGGHSLLATQVISRLREVLGVELPLQDFFAAPKVESVARKVEELQARSGGQQVPALVPAPRDGALPLSFAQQRLWFLDQLEPQNPLYNIPAAVRLEGELDVEVMGRCFEEILRRHEVLRTTFQAEGQEAVQRIHPAHVAPLVAVDLSALPEAEQRVEVVRLTEEEARKPFDLSRGPLVRLGLLRLSEREHVLFLTMHHIVSDGWSTGILLREVAALYEAFSAEKPSPLPELRIQYADYAAWQRGWLKGEALEAQLAYWRQRLQGAPALLELPTDKPRPAVQSYRGSHHVRRLSAELTKSLERLSRSEGVTSFMTLLAGFQVLLGRYSGQEDIVVGTGIAGRNRLETEGLIGFFINQLVLRGDLSGNPTCKELLARVRETTLGAYAHQELPFEALVKELNPERSLGHAPIFQVSLLLQNTPTARLELPGLTMSAVNFETGTSKLDLVVSLEETPDGLQSVWEYSTDLFEEGTIQRMAEHFERVLGQMAEDPGRRVKELEVMGAEERQRVVRDWNQTAVALPREACAHELFEARVARAPQAPAVSFEGQTLSYAELDRKANKLARHLKGLGVGPEVMVGLSMERSVELVVGMLGILKAGGAYVPLDPSYPADRLAMMMQEAALPVLLTQGKLASELPSTGKQVVRLDEDWAQIERQPEGRVESGGSGDNLAYVIFTSGSTGRPKGVMVRHRGLVNTALAAGEEHGVREDSRVLQYASMSFDASVCEVFSTLVAGACLCLAKREELMPGEPLTKTLLEQRISMVTLTPTVLAQQGVEGLEGVETVISAGEACTREVVGKWKVGRKLLNAYGPTEVTVCSTINKEVEEQRAGVIGKPWRNVRVYVLDGQGRPVPVGVAGELYVGGEGVARGYLGRADLTAEKFVPDALSGEAGARLYRTGDVVKWVEGGALEYVGRVDVQVKVRGFRIELGEVESVLRQQPGVADAVVVVRQETGDKRLVGYYVRQEGVAVEAGAVREGLKAKLPDYMVPSVLMELEVLPLTSSGKVDRKALPAPGAERPELGVAFVAPRNAVEELLASIWADVLGVERVGIHDNFFDLGGHSLLANQLVSRLRAALGQEISLRDIFNQPTVAGLAEKRASLRDAPGAALPPVLPTPPAEYLPLSFGQEAYWSPEQGGADSVVNSTPLALLLNGTLDVEAMRRSLTELIRRHESLRTTFPVREGVPVQRIHSPYEVELPVSSLESLPEEERQAEARRRVEQEVLRPFELAHGPLVRCHLFRISETVHVLLMNMHHALMDFVSLTVLVGELAALYVAYREGAPSLLPEPALQYRDFTRWQRQWMQGETLERVRSYWARRLEALPADMRLPLDFPVPAQEQFRSANVNFLLPPELAEQLRALCRREGVSLFMLALTAYQVLLSRYSRQEDIYVGFAHAQRPRPELEGMIGMFAGYFVIRTGLSGTPSFREVLGQVRTACLEAFEHQGLPHVELMKLLPGPCKAGFTFSSRDGQRSGVPGLDVHPVMMSRGVSLYDVKLSMSEGPEGLGGSFEYRAELFAPETIQAMRDCFEALLADVVAEPERPVRELAASHSAPEHEGVPGGERVA